MLDFGTNLSGPLRVLSGTYFVIYGTSKPSILVPVSYIYTEQFMISKVVQNYQERFFFTIFKLTLHFILGTTIICQVGAMIFTDNLFELTNILYVFLNVMVALAKATGFIFHGESVHNIFDSLNGRCFVRR